jgi:chromosome segregation ATPase
MSATPYNESPMELMDLLNLCRVGSEQLPNTIPTFIEKYMDETASFTKDGLKAYMNDIAGQISYLNREADPSQFAQPVFADIVVPISTFEENNTEELERNLALLNDEENELNKTIPYIEQQIALINTTEEGKMRECDTLYERVKDIKTCKKRVAVTYKNAWKQENKNLKDAKARFEKIGAERNKLVKSNEKFTKRMRKTSQSQQAQLEGRCKIGI